MTRTAKIVIPPYPLSAALLGALGATVFGYLATRNWGLGLERIALMLAAAQVYGLVILVAVVRLERVRWVKRRILVHPLVTWVLLLGCVTLADRFFFEELRSWATFAQLAFPLWFTNWWIAPIFGVIQDAWVRHDARVMSRKS